MLKRLLFLACVASLSIGLALSSCSSGGGAYVQKSNYQMTQVSKSSAPIISGAILWEDFLEKSHWHKNATDTKSADILISKSVCNVINNGDYFLQIITNTHSQMAESQLPIIFKIFEIGKLKNEKYQLYSANKENYIYGYNEIFFEAVPTLIINYKGKEIGRISELPKVSWEQDILSILYKN